jgi:nitrate/nitrite transporter NarK
MIPGMLARRGHGAEWYPGSVSLSLWHGMSHTTDTPTRRYVYLAALMLAGESIYMLPYMRKTFQSSMEAAYGVTTTELGTLSSMFGVLALITYFPGGWLADRLPARHLLTFSLVTTGAGGFYLMTYPGFTGLLGLHAFWGVTSILTFWAALIKATRNWGGSQEQGLGFGLLDGGRGIVAALLASLATAVFASGGLPQVALGRVLWVYSLAPIVAGILVWFVVPGRLGAPRHDRSNDAAARRVEGSRVLAAVRIPEVWLLAVIIFTAYWLYVGSFEFPAFAERAYGVSPEFAATLGTFRDWLRPVAALGAGLLADRVSGSRVIAAAFAILAASYASLGFASPVAGGVAMLWVQVSAAAIGVFALRGIYFALMEESDRRHRIGNRLPAGYVCVPHLGHVCRQRPGGRRRLPDLFRPARRRCRGGTGRGAAFAAKGASPRAIVTLTARFRPGYFARGLGLSCPG